MRAVNAAVLASVLIVGVYASTGTDALKEKLQSILDKHSSFWNASFSVGVHNSSLEVAVAAGLNDYANGSSKLTVNHKIPMGSTTKMFTAASVLKLAMEEKLSLNDTVAPAIDAYLAQALPCSKAPSMCKTQCAPSAHCFVQPTFTCKFVSKDKQATCSYCFRYLHCFASVNSIVPSKLTLKQIWDNDARIEEVPDLTLTLIGKKLRKHLT